MVKVRSILGILATMMLIGVAGAGTWAFFQDTAISQGNQVNTGTLNIHTWSTLTPFNVLAAGPGDKGVVAGSYNLYNSGSLTGDLSATVINAAESDGKGAWQYLTIYANGLPIYVKGVPQVATFGAFEPGRDYPVTITYDFAGSNLDQSAAMGAHITGDIQFTILDNKQ